MGQQEVFIRSITSFREGGVPSKKTMYNHHDNVVCVIHYDAQGRPLSGVCGDFMTWRMMDTHTIVISGDGNMDDFTWDSPPPWMMHEITSVIIEEGVQRIGNHAFTSVQTNMRVEKATSYMI